MRTRRREELEPEEVQASFATAKEVWREVEKAMGGPVPQAVKKRLEKAGYVEDAIRAGGVQVPIIVKAVERKLSRDARRPKTAAPAQRRQARDKGLSLRAKALAGVVALSAREDQEVARFRRRYLPDGAIPPAEIGSWIKRFAISGEGSSEARQWLHYLDEHGKPQSELVGGECALTGDLFRLVAHLGRTFNWNEQTAVTFALTDVAPDYHVIRAQGTYNLKLPALSTITLHVSLSISPAELAKEYGRIRQAILSSARKRLKPLSSNSLRRIVTFVDAGGDYRKAFDAWMADPTLPRYARSPQGFQTFKQHTSRVLASVKAEGLRDGMKAFAKDGGLRSLGF